MTNIYLISTVQNSGRRKSTDSRALVALIIREVLGDSRQLVFYFIV